QLVTQNLLQQRRAIKQQEIFAYRSQFRGGAIGADQGATVSQCPWLSIHRVARSASTRRSTFWVARTTLWGASASPQSLVPESGLEPARKYRTQLRGGYPGQARAAEL